ncbi:hypothetical protein L4D76_28320, partial [Photobacterium sagamiensis]|uniref:hypothetical protein n=1 Tax=Photobacterium sagamiensis TaxID=2910241 RepID=UPI003D0B9D95
SSVFASDKNDSYLCVAEEATGFFFDNVSWKQAKFNVKEHKFLIRKLKEDEQILFEKGFTYGAIELGSNYPETSCLPPNKHTGNIICNNDLGELKFSPNVGRFIKTYTSGYWSGEDNNNNTPYIERGKCSKL